MLYIFKHAFRLCHINFFCGNFINTQQRSHSKFNHFFVKSLWNNTMEFIIVKALNKKWPLSVLDITLRAHLHFIWERHCFFLNTILRHANEPDDSNNRTILSGKTTLEASSQFIWIVLWSEKYLNGVLVLCCSDVLQMKGLN